MSGAYIGEIEEEKLTGFTEGVVKGILALHKYRVLTIGQFAKIAGFSSYHAGCVLRDLAKGNFVGYFGFTAVPGMGKLPKVYFLKERGNTYLQNEYDTGIGKYIESELSWSPQTQHKLRLIDLFIALECSLQQYPHIQLLDVFFEYRRLKKTYQRETADFVDTQTKIIPDGAFVLENIETGRRGLFFVEMDMGTEQVAAASRFDTRASIQRKFENYDKYLTSGLFAGTYAKSGDFKSFTVLFVTFGVQRIENVQKTSASLSDKLHSYYRLATFEEATADFLGAVWVSRSRRDGEKLRIVAAR